MTTRNALISYRLSTGFTVLTFAALGATNLAHVPEVVEGVRHLGYPIYLSTILGIWQLLGAAAIAVPVSPRLEEWAYAGMFFNLTGAAASHLAAGDPLQKVLVPLVLLAAVMGSWALRSARAERQGDASMRATLAQS